MGRQIIQLVQVLVDRIEDAAARQQKHWQYWEEEGEKRKAAEKDRDHWRQARQDAIEAGELMKAEIESLRQQLAEAQQPDVDAMRAEVEGLRKFVGVARLHIKPSLAYSDVTLLLSALGELDAQRAPVDETAEGGT